MSTPLPIMVGLTADFHAHLAKGELQLQQCSDCKTFRHLPRYMCPSCHSDKWTWQRVSGEGEVFSWTTTMRPLHPAFVELPMTIVTVTLAEGPRLLGIIKGVAAEDMRVGMPVVVEPEIVSEGIGVPRFRPKR